MKFRKEQTEELTVNLTPLIDVVFLLLIFFMVSTTFTKETHLKVDLPEANGVTASSDTEQIEVVISAEGNYVINAEPLQDQLYQSLRDSVEQFSNGNNELPFIIVADAKTPHEAVVRAMDVAGQLGFSKLSIVTKRRNE